MKNTNLVVLIGRLTKDIELRKTPNGQSVTTFCLAVGRDKENTDWINCVAWEKTAELLNQYCHKGSKIEVTGSLRTRSWDDNGVKRYVTEVLTNSIEFLDSKNDTSNNQAVADADETAYVINVEPDDLPF